MQIAFVVLMVAVVLCVMLVLPIVAFRRARLQNPPGRDLLAVQRSDRPMPDKSYLGQGLGGM